MVRSKLLDTTEKWTLTSEFLLISLENVGQRYGSNDRFWVWFLPRCGSQSSKNINLWSLWDSSRGWNIGLTCRNPGSIPHVSRSLSIKLWVASKHYWVWPQTKAWDRAAEIVLCVRAHALHAGKTQVLALSTTSSELWAASQESLLYTIRWYP